MSKSEQLATLSVGQRNELESLLMEFDQAWSPDLLSDYCARLESAQSKSFRQVAVGQLVKIDMHRQWSTGSGKEIEAYLEQLPTLGTRDSVSPQMILAEFEARRSAGAAVDPDSYASRFPKQFKQFRRLVEQRSGSDSGHRSDTVPQHPSQASIDTSRIDKLHDTAAEEGRALARDLPVEFGRYRILRELGSGAMGTVYLAHDSQLDRQVALKTPSFGGSIDGDLVTRFYREARSAAKIQHRNICPVYDVGEIDGRHFISMAFVKGRCMSEFIKPGKLPPQKTSAVLVHRLALALAEAHRHSVIHRDLKPANIMIDRKREPVVMDFGLARQTDTESRVTQTGMAVGTPAYMSPEQIRGQLDEVGPPSDIYSLGVILYELLTGELPFRGAIAQVVYRIVNEDPVSPSQIRSEIDPELETICAKMMAKTLDMRYQSMDEVAADLKQYLQQEARGTPKRSKSQSGDLPSTSNRPRTASGVKASTSDVRQVSETGALNAFFAAQSVEDPMQTVVETGHSAKSVRPVEPAPRPSSSRAGDRSRWNTTVLIATGLGGLFLLAGVIIYLADGSRIEIPDDAEAKIETSADGGIKSVTVSPRPRAENERGSQYATAPKPIADQGSSDGGNVTPRDALTSADWEWTEPVYLGEFFLDSHDLDSELGDSVTTMYGSSYKHILSKGLASGYGGTDIWQFTRKPTDAHWRPPVNVGNIINSRSDDSGPSLSPDGLEMVFESNRSGSISKAGDLWISSRRSIDESWSKPVNLGPHINSPNWDGQACFAEDGLAIYFSSGRQGGYGESDLYMTRRSAIGKSWGAAVNLSPQVNSSAGELGPILSEDSLVLLFFDSGRPGGKGEFDVWMCQRASLSDAWSSPVNLGPPVNTSGHEFPGRILNGGRLLLFNRIPPGGQDAEGHGTWAVKRVPKRSRANTAAAPAAIVPAAIRPSKSQVSDEDQRWLVLFNGRDLTGWKQVHRHDVWNVRDGCIVSRARRGTEPVAGWLETDREFLDFELELDYELQREGNSGVFLRMVEGKTTIGADQLEIQLLDELAPKYRGSISDTNITGAIYGVVAPHPHAEAPVDQWNHMSIRAVGPMITVHVNGVQIVDADLDTMQKQIGGRFRYRQSGPIGLQWHGHSVRFRNLRIREL